MLKRFNAFMLRVLKVPPEPAPPAGAPGSLRIFRAGRNYLRLRMIAWVGTQLAAIWGLMVSLYFVREVEYQLDVAAALPRQEATAEPGLLVEIEPGVYDVPAGEHPPTRREILEQMAEGRENRRDLVHRLVGRFVPPQAYQLAQQVPRRVFFWIKFAEAVGVVVFAVQFVWTLGSVWIDFTQRWYMITDRSLRLRWGVMKIQETTMSFANLQQVSVHQGPLQRLLKLADVHVESAGGGSGGKELEDKDSMHRSSFHAVENATEIRDLILARLKRFRQAGLGDPDDPNDSVVAEAAPGAAADGGAETLMAARVLLAEARALRASLR